MSKVRRTGRLIAVFGIPRSGTSWLAKTLSFDRDYTYFREPDNFDCVIGAKRHFPSLYLVPGMDDAEYEAHMIPALSGKIANRFTLSEEVARVVERLPARARIVRPHLHRFLPRRRNHLIKLVNSNLAMQWLHHQFPHGKQVFIVRHPCGVFSSWQRLGWTPRPEVLTQRPQLMRDHLEPFRNLLLGAKSFWEKAGAYWGAITYVVHRQMADSNSGTFLQYEWLCSQGDDAFQALYSRLGLTWNGAVEKFLRDYSRPSEGPYSLKRDPLTQIDSWTRAVSPEEIAACRRFAEPFELPLYPDFRPTPAVPEWYDVEAC